MTDHRSEPTPTKKRTEHGILPATFPPRNYWNGSSASIMPVNTGLSSIYEGQLAVLGNSNKADVIRTWQNRNANISTNSTN